jgi:hypothetical protein
MNTVNTKTNTNFGEVIAALKQGLWARRAGWNGKGMHIYLEEDWSFPIRAGVYKKQSRQYGAVVVLYAGKDDLHQPGWVCSQADMMAEDWEIVQPA